MKNKKIVVLLVLVATGLIAGSYWLLFYAGSEPTAPKPQVSENQNVNKVDYGPPKDSDKIQESDKDKIINESPSNDSSSLGLQITTATQQESVIYIRTIISGASGGKCSLTITQGVHTIQKEVPIGVQSSYAVCQGFNIPTQEFPVSGIWDVKIVAISSSAESVESTTKLEVKK